MLSPSSWFVVISKPKAEESALKHLANQGFEVYLPMCPRKIYRRGIHLNEISPMFPRYLFVRPSREEQSIASICSTVGVQQLVRFGTEFAQAAESLISDIKALESRLHDDAYLRPFKAGDEVEIIDGPFAGVTARVLACAETRVMLLFQMLGSMRKLEFSVDQCRSI